jgi:hypothetical protein
MKRSSIIARRHVSDVCKSDFGHVAHALMYMGCLLSIDYFWFLKVNFIVICPSKIKKIILKLKGKWHFGATFRDNEGKNVIGCIYLMNITGARGTDHPLFLTFCLQFYFQENFFISLIWDRQPVWRTKSSNFNNMMIRTR